MDAIARLLLFRYMTTNEAICQSIDIGHVRTACVFLHRDHPEAVKYKTRDRLRTLNSWKKMKTRTYEIDEHRVLTYNKKKAVITICDKKTGKEAVFTPARWASFRLYMDEVDDKLNSLSQDRDVVYCTHYGGGWSRCKEHRPCSTHVANIDRLTNCLISCHVSEKQ